MDKFTVICYFVVVLDLLVFTEGSN
ncbi:hypothetical protein Bhyg_02359 [Pseudolycoriella hygida]|uniref:Uncharacterized protein n=1 Tax=Pseudolycoriella hygida TaxID=35572 RepID=A0A9Q0S6K6_9DIPT|nr:hypothetical protein Bhyg_02359 [Pseudolycoriella hygida]